MAGEEQPSLFDGLAPLTPIRARDHRTLTERFEAFDRANPQVYSLIVRMALDLAQRGRRFGVKMLYERLRYEYAVRTTDSTPYKLDNCYTSRYARKLISAHPELAVWLETRELRSV